MTQYFNLIFLPIKSCIPQTIFDSEIGHIFPTISEWNSNFWFTVMLERNWQQQWLLVKTNVGGWYRMHWHVNLLQMPPSQNLHWKISLGSGQNINMAQSFWNNKQKLRETALIKVTWSQNVFNFVSKKLWQITALKGFFSWCSGLWFDACFGISEAEKKPFWD